jgi:hypothetical protein
VRGVVEAVLAVIVIVVAIAVVNLCGFFGIRYWKWRQSRWDDDWRWHL